MTMHEESQPIHPVEGKTLGVVDASRLQQGTLKLVDIATSTMANIAPVMSFFSLLVLVTLLRWHRSSQYPVDGYKS